jgi:hypothetical protein
MARRTALLLAIAGMAAFLASPAAAHEGARAHPLLGAFAQSLIGFHPAAESASRELEVVGLADPREDSNGNVWAHRGYAYMASYGNQSSSCGSGVRVFDLRNPKHPRRVAAFGRADSSPALAGAYTDQVRIQRANTPSFRGDLAGVGLQRCRPPFDGSGGTRGFALYDVTRPARPQLLSIVNTVPVAGSHELWLQAVGKRVYLYTAIPRAELRGSPDGVVPGNPDFRIYDVSDPRRPVQVGQWGIWANLGLKPTSDEFVHSVITNPSATRAYLSYWEFGTVILDISNPALPIFLSRARDPNQTEPPHSHSAALAAGGRLLVETQEFGSFFRFHGTGYPRFFDLSDERNPRLISLFVPPGTEASTAHDPKVVGNRLYVSWYDKGVYVLDIRFPRFPRAIGHLVPGAEHNSGNPFCPDCTFVWGIFPYLDYFVASDMNSGLWVLKLRCKVPNLRGLTVARARTALTGANCRTGRIKRVSTGSARRGRVVGQRPAPGARPAFPAAVRLSVGA